MKFNEIIMGPTPKIVFIIKIDFKECVISFKFNCFTGISTATAPKTPFSFFKNVIFDSMFVSTNYLISLDCGAIVPSGRSLKKPFSVLHSRIVTVLKLTVTSVMTISLATGFLVRQ